MTLYLRRTILYFNYNQQSIQLALQSLIYLAAFNSSPLDQMAANA